MSIELVRFEMAVADDASALQRAIEGLGSASIAKAALILRLPGDYTDGAREKGRAAAERVLADRGLIDRTEMVTVIGSEGFAGTFGYLLVEIGDGRPDGRLGGTAGNAAVGGVKRLALGIARGVPARDEDIDRVTFVPSIVEVVRRAIADAGVTAADVVHVLINTPAPVHGNAALRGRRARAMASLAAGVAIGDLAAGDIDDDAVLTDTALHTMRTQSFSGPTVKQVEVIVLGNKAGAGGSLLACSAIADEAADVRQMKRMLMDVGLTLDATGELRDPTRVKAMIYKSGVRTDGRVHGHATQVYNGQIPPEKHVRAAQSGMLAALLGTPLVFNTFDPVHQCPEGGAVACAIVDVGAA